MEQEKFNELMQATDVLYHMIWRNPSGGYIKGGKEYVYTNRIESLSDIKKSLAIVTDFVNKISGEENEDNYFFLEKLKDKDNPFYDESMDCFQMDT